MARKTRLDNAIYGLSEIVQRNKRQDKYRVSGDKFIIDNSSPQFIAILLISLVLLLPVGLILYYLLSDNASSIVFWSLLLEIIFVNDFYKLLRGNTTFTIDFNERYIQAEYSLTRMKNIS